jgi:hypothetical protein
MRCCAVSPSRKPTRLRAIRQVWATIAEQSDKEGWPAARFLAALAEHEIADRGRRRIERHLAEHRLPVGQALDSFDFDAAPMVSKAQVVALTAGDSWFEKGTNLLLFGPPGGASDVANIYFGVDTRKNFVRSFTLIWPRFPKHERGSLHC